MALVASVLAAATAIGLTDLPSSFVPGAALVVPWFVLGFALYAVGFGVAGALVTRQEDVSTVSIPVTGVMTVSFFLAYGALQSAPDGILAQVVTVFPTTAPFMLPARSAMAGVPAWQDVLALTLRWRPSTASYAWAAASTPPHCCTRVPSRDSWAPGGRTPAEHSTARCIEVPRSPNQGVPRCRAVTL